MKRLELSAMTMEETELMITILDKWLRHFFNTYGVKRVYSFNRKANDNIRACIYCEIDSTMWDYIRDGFMWEVTRRLKKGTTCHYEKLIDLIDFSTCEAAL